MNMLCSTESIRTLRIGLLNAGEYPTVDIVGVSAGNTLFNTLVEHAPAFAELVAQFVRDHTAHGDATAREAAIIEVRETQLLP